MRVRARPFAAAVMERSGSDDASDAGLTGFVQAAALAPRHEISMNSIGLSVYAAALVILFGKFVVTISLQGLDRIRGGRFRYPEDAAHWKGEVTADTDRCDRAQRLLRNDGEGQPYFFALGALYLVLGAWPLGAPIYFGVYTLSRVLHALWLFRGTQPHRNRAFGLGLLTLVVLAGHVAFEAAGRLY